MKKDGTVVTAGKCVPTGIQLYDTTITVKTEDWNDIIAISTSGSHTVGLRVDGTVVAVGDNKYGECNIQDWRDIIAISAGYLATFGLKKDGTITVMGLSNSNVCPKWDNIGLVLDESEFAQECNSKEVYDIIEAVGGMENICTCDLSFIESGEVKLLLNNRSKADVATLEKVSGGSIVIQAVIENVTYWDYVYTPFLQIPKLKELNKREDLGKGVVNMQFPNIRLEIKNEFESILPMAKIGVISY